MSYACKTATAQSQQISTLAKLPTYSKLLNLHATMPTMLVLHTNDTNHLFNCSQLPTKHSTTSLWKKHLHVEAAEVIHKWKSRLLL